MFGCCPGIYDSDNSCYSDEDDDDEDEDELDDEILQRIAQSFRKKFERKPTDKGSCETGNFCYFLLVYMIVHITI